MADAEGGKKQAQSKEDKKHSQHSILLVQPSKHDSTRSYQNFRAPTEAWEYLLRSFETRLRELNPYASSIGYGETALQQYMDDLKELVLLVHDPEMHAYRSYDRKYIKQQVLDYLSAMVPAPASATDAAKA